MPEHYSTAAAVNSAIGGRQRGCSAVLMWHHIVVPEEVEVLVAFACDERVRGLVGQRGQGEELLERAVAGAGLPIATRRLLRPACNVDARVRTARRRRVRG
ncbi:hypothetical protein R3Q08_26600 [Rhodococcus erythropolis]|uniref:hypothetical protein n=1 Tax=Rhodococcus erythropolis TaxID=1833 RepID=UPI002949FA42|nr:hypothetical protein [Rhodococcus erythropolis]MDV6211841.1 hypothetical protein [Rhodococcus erythropolis]